MISFSLAQKLNLGEITPTNLSLQMVDRSLTFPKGIVEDVLVKVDKFIFPMDFVVLDTKEDRAAPMILGRPFLATGQSLINVKNRELTLRVGEDQVKFNLYKSMGFPSTENASCMRIDALIPLQEDVLYDFGKSSQLEQCLTKSLTTVAIGDEDLSSTQELIETILALQENEEESVLDAERDSRWFSVEGITEGPQIRIFGMQ